MAKLSKDQIGDLGELLAAADLSRPVAGRWGRPLFRATSLGGKYPAVDFLVDLLADDDATVGFFLAQVRATFHQATPTRDRLRITVPKRKLDDIARLPVPAYLIGVDLRTETTYLVSVKRSRPTLVSSITTAYKVAADWVKIGLYEEVLSFWGAVQRIPFTTRFIDAR
jgi:hypothetical protein